MRVTCGSCRSSLQDIKKYWYLSWLGIVSVLSCRLLSTMHYEREEGVLDVDCRTLSFPRSAMSVGK